MPHKLLHLMLLQAFIVSCLAVLSLFGCRRKQEELEQELEKYSLRRAPLGLDRHYRAYWWGLAGQRAAVYVQHEAGPLQVLRSPEELAALMAGLDKRGVRELALFEALEKVPGPLLTLLRVPWHCTQFTTRKRRTLDL